MQMIVLSILLGTLALEGIPAVVGGSSSPVTPPLPDYYDVACSQPFNYSALASGLGFSGSNSFMLADDFTTTSPSNINYIEIWAIYTSGNPTSFRVQFRSDASGPGAILTDFNTTAVFHVNTGLSWYGYPLWYTEISPGVTFTASPGTKYWFCLQTLTGGMSYWLSASQTWADMAYHSSNNGSTWLSSQQVFGAAYEQFVILSDIVALERNSWGGIKTLF